MIIYLDTSALVKLFVDEPETSIVADALHDASAVFTHMITYAEARAALAKAVRMKRIIAESHAADKAALEDYWDNLEVIAPDMPLIKQAGNMAETYGLRGYDSIHLAAAELVSRQSDALTFACFDNNLNKAAKALNFETLV